jgi:hypothetical protein
VNEELRVPSEAARLDDALRCLAAVHDDLLQVMWCQDKVGPIEHIRSTIREHLEAEEQ